MAKAFRGSETNKVDSKGRVSIPATFRDVIAEEDPKCQDGKSPRFVLVYGDHTRDFIECFSMASIVELDAKIQKLPMGSAQRERLEEFYSGFAIELALDDTGRIVLPKEKVREKLGIADAAFFIASGDRFRIWKPETYDARKAARAAASENFDPDVDPTVYLQMLN